MLRFKKTFVVFLFAMSIGSVAGFGSDAIAANDSTAENDSSETKEQRDQRMAWWREARFGLFVHWGVYSVPAGTWNGQQIPSIGEWIMSNAKIPVLEYAKLTAQFNPVKFNADEWVSIAKNAGMKYIIITSKHHDGFAMFHSKASPFNIYDATPFKRDPLKELAEACQKQGIRLGFYYSQAQDWHHPGGAAWNGHWDKAQDGDMTEYIKNIAAPQVKELLTNYGPVAVFWWDTDVDMTKERADLLRPLLKLQPGIIMNDRLGGGYPGDTETPEQDIPSTGISGRDWETCMTMNNTWGYKSYENDWKSTELLVHNLVDIASKGGNYLLNVGPTAEGLIPQPSVERLAEVGQWMKVNGEAIYGTSASPCRLPWGRCTQKPGRLYLHVFDWPTGDLVVPGLKNPIKSAYLLADPVKKAIPITIVDDSVSLQVPAEAPSKFASVVVLEIEGKPEFVPCPVAQAADGSLYLAAANADVHGEQLRFQNNKGIDHIGVWTARSEWISWDVKVKKPGEFEVEIDYACENSAAGSEYAIAVGGRQVVGKIDATGAWAHFVTSKLGTLTIPEAGRHTISLKATTMPHQAVMDLKAIRLRPAKVDCVK